ncbi:hypothetical protein V8D89_000579 [Ganoderma adspersum]
MPAGPRGAPLEELQRGYARRAAVNVLTSRAAVENIERGGLALSPSGNRRQRRFFLFGRGRTSDREEDSDGAASRTKHFAAPTPPQFDRFQCPPRNRTTQAASARRGEIPATSCAPATSARAQDVDHGPGGIELQDGRDDSADARQRERRASRARRLCAARQRRSAFSAALERAANDAPSPVTMDDDELDPSGWLDSSRLRLPPVQWRSLDIVVSAHGGLEWRNEWAAVASMYLANNVGVKPRSGDPVDRAYTQLRAARGGIAAAATAPRDSSTAAERRRSKGKPSPGLEPHFLHAEGSLAVCLADKLSPRHR